MTHKYSLATIENAKLPGKMIAKIVNIALPPSKNPEFNTVPQPSRNRLTTPRTTAMSGASQKIVANGFDNPMECLCITVSVKAHLRPDNAEAENTMMIPGMSTVVVSNNMRNTPNVMSEMTAMRRREYDSSLNANAAMRTKMRVEDLHIATYSARFFARQHGLEPTVKTEGNGLER